MKKLLKHGVLLLATALVLEASFVQAFNSGTHIYIAERVFPSCSDKINLDYGSIAPDLALYVASPGKWPTAFADTHYAYIDLRRYAWTSDQRAFAKGWLTHNEDWGADYYAHIEYPPGNGVGYVVGKAEILSSGTGINPEFAHFVIEVAIDLLLKWNDDSGLGKKLLEANLLRCLEDRSLLTWVLVLKEKRTDWITLVSTELTFRNLVGEYAMAFSLPWPFDKGALIELGVQLAKEIYGKDVSYDDIEIILEAAIGLCKDDYKAAIDATINGIKDHF